MRPDRDSGLVFASYLAPNIRPVYEFVAERVGAELGCRSTLVTGESFDQLRSARVHFAFLCGLPYVRLRRETLKPVDALAAPVLSGERYAGGPVYFSDVIVAAGSSAESLDDLRGSTWAYNEPDSHSGYLATLFRLYEMGESERFFERWVMTGFHQESIRLVATGQVDASAVDSQVLAVELRDHPELRDRLHVIDSIGPSTIQPLVATRAASATLRQEVTEIVTQLGRDGAGRAGLAQGLVERLVAVDDAGYRDIRAMLEAVEAAGLDFQRRPDRPTRLAGDAHPGF